MTSLHRHLEPHERHAVADRDPHCDFANTLDLKPLLHSMVLLFVEIRYWEIPRAHVRRLRRGLRRGRVLSRGSPRALSLSQLRD